MVVMWCGVVGVGVVWLSVVWCGVCDVARVLATHGRFLAWKRV